MVKIVIPESSKQEILYRLNETYHDSRSALHFQTPYQLLVAVILSAQTNDNQVNKITDELFPAYPGPRQISSLSLMELENKIKTCGLYHNKAKNILAATAVIIKEYGGEVPADRDKLMLLPGVGRKTANVILSVAFGLPALAVDTHVFRVARRLGLAHGATPEKVEAELCLLIPQNHWSSAHHWLIWHGRKLCSAQRPHCRECFLNDICPSKQLVDNREEKMK